MAFRGGFNQQQQQQKSLTFNDLSQQVHYFYANYTMEYCKVTTLIIHIIIFTLTLTALTNLINLYSQ